ncbi:MAG: hypothetical protein ACRD21_15120 [Vicinamibacteria bacterium]
MPDRLVRFYYWLTPAFWAADVLLGANLRTAALDGHPAWKVTYYLFCLACGVALWLRPGWTKLVGMTEASVNVFVIILGAMLPYFQLIDRLAAGETAIDASPFGIEKSVSLVLSGAVCVISFRMHANGLQGLASAKRKSA